jgi:cell division protein FtsB
MSDTPRTDKACATGTTSVYLWELSRELERENAKLRAENAELIAQNNRMREALNRRH